MSKTTSGEVLEKGIIPLLDKNGELSMEQFPGLAEIIKERWDGRILSVYDAKCKVCGEKYQEIKISKEIKKPELIEHSEQFDTAIHTPMREVTYMFGPNKSGIRKIVTMLNEHVASNDFDNDKYMTLVSALAKFDMLPKIKICNSCIKGKRKLETEYKQKLSSLGLTDADIKVTYI